MADHTPPTDQQLDEIDARRQAATPGPWGTYEYGGDSLIEIAADLEDTGCGYRARRTVCRFDEEPLDNDPTHREWTGEEDWAQVQADAAFIAHARADVDALAAEVRRLRAQVDQLDRALGETIDDRDQAQEIADKLAYAVAPEEVIGEHSSMNCPWTNALELITPKAEVDKLRARIAELETYAHGCDTEGHVLPHSSWCEAAKKTAADNDGCTCGQPWADHPQPHAMHCWTVNPPRAEVEEMRRALAAGRAQAWRDLADRADPQRPEISFFGNHGHEVGAWIRKQAEYEEPAAVPAAVETGE